MQAAIIPSRSHAYVFFSIENLKTPQWFGRHRAAFDSGRCTLLPLSSGFVARKATACAGSDFGLSFSGPKKNRDFAPQICGPAELSRSICSSEVGPHAAPHSAFFLYGESFWAVLHKCNNIPTLLCIIKHAYRLDLISSYSEKKVGWNTVIGAEHLRRKWNNLFQRRLDHFFTGSKWSDICS